MIPFPMPGDEPLVEGDPIRITLVSLPHAEPMLGRIVGWICTYTGYPVSLAIEYDSSAPDYGPRDPDGMQVSRTTPKRIVIPWSAIVAISRPN